MKKLPLLPLVVSLSIACLVGSVVVSAAGMKETVKPAKSPAVVMQSTALPPKYEQIYDKLKKERTGISCDRTVRKVDRLGDNTVALESFLCMEADFPIFRRIAGDWIHYDKWVLNRINEKTGGGGYLIKFLDVTTDGKSDVILRYLVDFPLLKKERSKHFKMTTESFPRAFVLTGEGIEDEASLLVYARAEMVAFAAPGKDHELWIHVQGKAKLKSGFLYEALPEKILRTEAGDRIQRVLENYEAREIALKTNVN